VILSDILFELKRIANSLEAIAGTKLEQVPKNPAPTVEFFDSRLPDRNSEEELQENRFNNRIEQELNEASKKGLLFEEDALPYELLERL